MSQKRTEGLFQSEGHGVLKYGIAFLAMSVAYFAIFYFLQRELMGVLTFIVFVGATTEGFVRMQNGGNAKTAMIISAKYIGIGLVYHLCRYVLAMNFGVNLPF